MIESTLKDNLADVVPDDEGALAVGEVQMTVGEPWGEVPAEGHRGGDGEQGGCAGLPPRLSPPTPYDDPLSTLPHGEHDRHREEASSRPTTSGPPSPRAGRSPWSRAGGEVLEGFRRSPRLRSLAPDDVLLLGRGLLKADVVLVCNVE